MLSFDLNEELAELLLLGLENLDRGIVVIFELLILSDHYIHWDETCPLIHFREDECIDIDHIFEKQKSLLPDLRYCVSKPSNNQGEEIWIHLDWN